MSLQTDLEGPLSTALTWALLGSGAWLALITLLLAAEVVVTGTDRRTGRFAPRIVRLVVLSACGAGLAAGVAAPAMAEPRAVLPEVHLLDGLPLPDRVVDVQHVHQVDRHRSPAPDRVKVHAGDSLWQLALEHDTDWQTLYAANRDVVGPDPDLIHPGQRLVLPTSDTERGRR